jgi:ribosomal protein L11 methyltransferase
MDKHIKVGDQILDFGCGSGILGLAGILLGAEHMDGIDIDPQALTATQNNAETNAIDNDKFQVTTKTEDLADEYDTVIANILAGTLVDLSSVILSKLKSKGHLVLSGILSHQAETVLEAYRDQIVFQPMSEKEGWVCLSGQKK